jgi:DNA (cytosine-5)-methyltransferase 1
MNHGSLFSGIGGFDLAAEWMGWNNVFHCEINDFGKKILNYYWPNAISYDDIKKTDFTIHRGSIDILTGGFPCQPYSMAGKRKGKEDERHLWPRWIVGENVRGIISWNGGMVFEEVQTDLEAIGYEVLPFLLPAAAVNAPHRRDRVWFVAYSKSKRRWQQPQEDRAGKDRQFNNDGEIWNATDTDSEMLEYRNRERTSRESTNKKERIKSFSSSEKWETFPTQPPVCGGDDGIPRELDGIAFSKWRNESIKGYGNAIVPQVVYQIFKAIEQYDNQRTIPTGS